MTVGALSGQGTVRLDVNGAGTGIADAAGNELAAGFTGRARSSRGCSRATAPGCASTSGGALERQRELASTGSWAAAPATRPTSPPWSCVDDGLVHLDAPRTIGHLVFGDTDPASAASWIVDDNGVPENVLTLGRRPRPPSPSTRSAPGATTSAGRALGRHRRAHQARARHAGARPAQHALGGAERQRRHAASARRGASLNTGTGTINVGITAGVHLHVERRVAGHDRPGHDRQRHRRRQRRRPVHARLRHRRLRRPSAPTPTPAARSGSTAGRSPPPTSTSAATARPPWTSTRGFIVNGGTVTVGTMGLGTNNSNGALTVAGGTLTATGTVTIANQVDGRPRRRHARDRRHLHVHRRRQRHRDRAQRGDATLNNVGVASFTAGVATAEKITLGFDAAVTAGSATVNVNGGTLYLGAGGIVKERHRHVRDEPQLQRRRSGREGELGHVRAHHAARGRQRRRSRPPTRPTCRTTSRSTGPLSGPVASPRPARARSRSPAPARFTGPVWPSRRRPARGRQRGSGRRRDGRQRRNARRGRHAGARRSRWRPAARCGPAAPRPVRRSRPSRLPGPAVPSPSTRPAGSTSP